ncbi:hypothetical protein GH714_025380 [Hevea brasiliensis]|uniref:Trehalose 6-phosphate phosphatase n=1 Tax=Hevea brasiliensis TaxID=3981 RepID=A0A6A6KRB4_HEVBR|nr:hypothetical protein GH714_025380 [Hevea brasiliensis]
MTNQNVVASDAKSSRIRFIVRKSIFSPAVPNPLPAPSLAKKIETGGAAAKTNAWVDSMRDSSPTRVKSTASLSETKRKILGFMFEQIANASKGKQIAMFLDYDDEKAVRDVARCFPTAIVTGRCRDKIYSFVKLAGLYYAGSHGMDIKDHPKVKNTKSVQSSDRENKSICGAKVENNKFAYPYTSDVLRRRIC